MEEISRILIRLFIVVVGLVWGSFLNVLIFRIPRDLNIIKPRSFCPSCGKKIKWYDNIPVLSYIFLGGKCRNCYQKISVRYPVVEIITSSSFLIVYERYYYSFYFIGSLIFVSALIALAFIDLEHQILPDVITIPGFIFFSAYSVANPFLGFKHLILGALVGSGTLLLIYLIYLWLRKEEGLGFGDIKMMLLVGAFLGWRKSLLTLIIASFLGAMVGVIMIVFKKKGLKFALPFGTFLSLSAFLSLLYGDIIIDFYLSLSQF
ncbi:MAG: prepilin peptidase [Acidobacteriota bacterium]